MNHINNLLMKARKAVNGKGLYIMGFLDDDIDKQKYTVKGTIWDGVPGSGGKEFYSEHDTQEEARKAFDDITAKYPGAVDVVFLEKVYE